MHGIIVQMPLDSEQEVQSLIAIIYFLSSTLIRVLASKHKVQNLIASAKKILLISLMQPFNCVLVGVFVRFNFKSSF